jgi:hypothetical protein
MHCDVNGLLCVNPSRWYQDMRAVYAYYMVPGRYDLKTLMSDALVLAKRVRGEGQGECMVVGVR